MLDVMTETPAPWPACETPAPWPARDSLRITAVRAVVTAPEGVPLAWHAPGGIDLDEEQAARYPPQTHLHERWAARVRRPDGGIGGGIEAP